MTDSAETPDDEQGELFDAVEVDERDVPLDAIEPTNETAPASLDNAIGQLGLVSTPLLQLEKESNEYGYRIVDGVRRIATLREQGRESVSAYVVGPEFESEAAALTAVLNIVRDPAPLREAKQIADLIEARGYTPEALSRIGIPQQTTKKRLRLWNAPEAIKDGVREGNVAVGTAEKVANLSHSLQDECAEFYKENGKLRRKDLREIRQADREEQAGELPQKAFDTPDVCREEDGQEDGGEAPSEDGASENEPDVLDNIDLPTDADVFSDYIVVAGIVRKYLNDEDWDPSPEEVTQEVISVVTNMGLAPEEGLALLMAPPGHFLPEDTINDLHKQIG